MYIKKITTYKLGEHEQSTDGGETTTVGGETSSKWAKRLSGETSKDRSVLPVPASSTMQSTESIYS